MIMNDLLRLELDRVFFLQYDEIRLGHPDEEYAIQQYFRLI
jgi:hypothetical protein